MNLSIRRAEAGADGPVVQALLELYLHDMSEWYQFEINDDGTYGYDMSEYWADDEPVYLAEVEGMPAGFALICTNPAVPERPRDRPPPTPPPQPPAKRARSKPTSSS